MSSLGRLGPVLIVVALAALDAQAATVRGRVERQTPYGVVAAGYMKVSLVSPASGRSSPAYTNAQGTYYLYNVPAGSYTLEIWHGPNPVRVPVTVTSGTLFTAPTVTVR